jgi:hypothetical protein
MIELSTVLNAVVNLWIPAPLVVRNVMMIKMLVYPSSWKAATTTRSTRSDVLVKMNAPQVSWTDCVIWKKISPTERNAEHRVVLMRCVTNVP